MIRKLLAVSACLALSACASTSVTRVKALAPEADAPYDNVLVISLFKSFDARRILEKQLVKSLEERGVSAVASTSRMDSRTPVTRETFLGMVNDLDSDAVLVTQLAKRLQELSRGLVEAALAEHRLEDDGSNVLCFDIHLKDLVNARERIFYARAVVRYRKVSVEDGGHGYTRACFVRNDLASQRACHLGSAVESTCERDDALAARRRTRNLD